MKYPDEVDIMSFFECEPISLDSENVPFFYNESTYKYVNGNNQTFTIKLCPSNDELTILVKIGNKSLGNIKLNSVSDLSILSDKKEEKRMMVTSELFILKMTLKPEFHLEFIEEKKM